MDMGLGIFLLDSFRLWLNNLFVTPFSNLEIFWILAPVYIGLILAELFQEKKGTSFGNAISNSVIALWGGIDFLRIIVNNLDSTGFTTQIFWKLIISLIIIMYGLTVMVLSFKGKNVSKYVGRIREVSYVVIIFAPLYYTDTRITFMYFFGAMAYFYIFYVTLEVIDKFTPDPKAFLIDVKEATGQISSAPSINAPVSNSSPNRFANYSIQSNAGNQRGQK